MQLLEYLAREAQSTFARAMSFRKRRNLKESISTFLLAIGTRNAESFAASIDQEEMSFREKRNPRVALGQAPCYCKRNSEVAYSDGY
jgi:hypothetical protein